MAPHPRHFQSQHPLVLLVPGDRLTGLLTKKGLEGYGYDVLTASRVEEAADLLRINARISVLVVDIKLEDASTGLALAKAARMADPTVHIIYTYDTPHRLPEREKVRSAPCFRTPYHPHQLVGDIGQMSNQNEAYAA
jgi:CheY-like chemotaxis protein